MFNPHPTNCGPKGPHAYKLSKYCLGVEIDPEFVYQTDDNNIILGWYHYYLQCSINVIQVVNARFVGTDFNPFWVLQSPSFN